MAAAVPPNDKGKPYTYQRRIVLPVLIIMVVTIIVGVSLQIAATVSHSWARTTASPAINWGFTQKCSVITMDVNPHPNPDDPSLTDYDKEERLECVGMGLTQCNDDPYFGNTSDCRDRDATGTQEIIVSVPEMEAAQDNLKTARALSIVTTIFSLTPLPFVFLAFFKELRWGIYSMPLYALWFIFWVSTICVFNKNVDFVINYKPSFGNTQAYTFEAGTAVTSLYDAGAFLHVGAFVAIGVSCLSFWASYLACFQVDVYDADGNLVSVEELLAKRQAANNGGNTVSTQSLVAQP